MNAGSPITRETTVDIIAMLFILLFVYTATSKLLYHERFMDALLQSVLLHRYARVVAWAVPLAEILCGVLLVIPKTKIAGMILSSGVLLLFTCYILMILVYSPYVPCTCGGVVEWMSWRAHLIFNLAFLLLGISGIYLQLRSSADKQLIAGRYE